MESSMARIALVTLLAISAALASAEDTRKLPKIGVVFGTNPVIGKPFDEALREGLHSLGYVEGENVLMLRRYAQGDAARFPAMIRELIGLNVDVLLVPNTAVAAAVRSTKTVPIVGLAMADPVAAGFVSSLARPGTNLTGLYGLFRETHSKRLQLAIEVVPGLKRAAVIFEADPHLASEADELRLFAQSLGVTLHPIAVHNAKELEAALKLMERDRSQALILFGSPLMYIHAQKFIAGVVSHKVPVISEARPFAEAGAVLAYGPDNLDMWKRAGIYVDKILKGAKAAELPIEQPTKFNLVVNMRVAHVLGISIPESILLRANEVIR